MSVSAVSFKALTELVRLPEGLESKPPTWEILRCHVEDRDLGILHIHQSGHGEG
jgi:hypothetical protein